MLYFLFVYHTVLQCLNAKDWCAQANLASCVHAHVHGPL